MTAGGRTSVLLFLVALVLSSPAMALTFTDPGGAYTLTIPEGFQPVPKESFGPNVICQFIQVQSDENNSFISIGLLKGSGLLPQVRARQAPPPDRGTRGGIRVISTGLGVASWKYFSIDVVEEHMEGSNGQKLLALTANVPARPVSLGLTVLGTEADRDRLKTMLDQVLLGLVGETNWRPGGNASPPSSEDQDWGITGWKGALMALGLGGVAAFSAKGHRLATLAVGACLVALGFALCQLSGWTEPNSYGMVFMLCGTGVVVLALIDGVRHGWRRKKPAESVEQPRDPHP